LLALPVDLSKKFVVPPSELLTKPEDLSKKFVVPPSSLEMLAPAALEWLKKFVAPPSLEIETLLPAVALLAKRISPPATVARFCVSRELFVMPTPLIVSVNPGLAVMV
jgi:hypothetical protein